jgi:hypothetical protein
MDTIFQYRLDALEKNLTLLENSPTYFESREGFSSQHFWQKRDIDIPNLLENTIKRQAGTLKSEVIEIRDILKGVLRWDEIPGKDDERLIEFLKQKFGVDWVKTAKIERIDVDKTIRVYTERNSISLKLNDEQNEVTLEIDDGKTNKFLAKTENNKIKIYKNEKLNKTDLREAWKEYSEVYKSSQDLFREWIEFFGGLYIRDMDPGAKENAMVLDTSISEIADDLVRRCAKDSVSIDFNYLTIPTYYEPLTKTLTRVIRLRFPEWNIWMLPFTAHELGHVLIEMDINKGLIPFMESRSKIMADLDTNLRNPPEDNNLKNRAKERALEKARYHLHEFMADAFATYAMGPAYACSAIMLRLNPWTSYESNLPGDVERAFVIITMLRSMNKNNNYDLVLEKLEEKWNSTLNQSTTFDRLTDENRKNLNQLVLDIKELFRNQVVSAKYPLSGRDGWLTAKNWSAGWDEQLIEGKELSKPEVTKTDKVRDALNAAWLSRLDLSKKEEGRENERDTETERVRKIQVVAQKLCDEIIGIKPTGMGANVPGQKMRTPE